MDNGIQPVMNMNGDGGFGMGGWGGIIGLLAVLGLANGGFGFGNNDRNDNDVLAAVLASQNRGYQPQYATQQDVQYTSQFGQLLDGNRDLSNLITNGTAQAVAATNNTFHDTLAVLNDKYSELQRDVAGLAVGQANALANQNQCCCDTKMLIQQTNYDAAMRDAATNANFTAQIQGVKDMIAQDKIEALQAQVSQLQLAQATNGMLRFPNSWSYGAGPFPPIFGGCCGNNGFNNI